MVSGNSNKILKSHNWYTHAFTALVRKEIADETDRETGRTKQISTVPIYLSIYSPNGKTTILAMCWLSLYCLPLLLYHVSIVQLWFCGVWDWVVLILSLIAWTFPS